MIRITGGRFRGQQIFCPKGEAVRPTTSFMRESLFSILATRVMDAHVLDLFAGCGTIGFEALSRGAREVLAVEKSGAQVRMLERSRDKLKLGSQEYQIIHQDVFAWVKAQPVSPAEVSQFDLIFLDPPYALEGVETIILTCFEKRLLHPSGQLVWENAAAKVPEPLMPYHRESRKYGNSALSFFSFPDGPESGRE